MNEKLYYSKHRIITLGDINNENACNIISFIEEINDDDKTKEVKKRSPIKLIIISEGGSVYDGLGIIDSIKNSTTPIHTYIYGQAQSAAFAIATCGHYRYSAKHTTFMYHELWWSTQDEKMKYHEQEITEGKRIWELYDNIITSNTNIPLKKLNQVKKERKEWYINSEEALELGIIDEII